MSLIVQKYGGTSVRDIASMMHVARKIKATQNAGHDVVVVVSAMGDQTDRLEALAYQITDMPNAREMDVLLASGEQVSIALLSMALQSLGCEAKSYTGFQVAIRTDSAYGKARIEHINELLIRNDLAEGKVIIVAGFQGVDEKGNITTLGRGGSDTTAAALAAALQASECQIYTDVEGVFTTDPRLEPNARKLSSVTFDEMLELASSGAQVLQIRAVEFARKYKIPLRVLSTFKEGVGTLITDKESDMEQPFVSGVAFSRQEARLSIFGVPDEPGVAGQILGPISDANIEVDLVTQSRNNNGLTDFTFLVQRRDCERAMAILQEVNNGLNAQGVNCDTHVAKLSLVGVGMRSHAPIASTMFRVLGAQGINIQLIAVCEIKVSVVVDEKYIELGVRKLHEAFALHQPSHDKEYEHARRSA